MVAQLVESDLKSGNNTLTNFLFGGAPSSKNLIKDATTAFPTISLSQAYGLTETNSVAVSMAGEDYLVRPAACGKATPVNEVKIMDPEKNVEMPLGQPGEIWIRGVNVAVGYWNNPKATAEAFTKDQCVALAFRGAEMTPSRQLVQVGRRGLHGQGRLPVYQRPDEGRHHPRRREHCLEHGRECQSVRSPSRRLRLTRGSLLGHAHHGLRRHWRARREAWRVGGVRSSRCSLASLIDLAQCHCRTQAGVPRPAQGGRGHRGGQEEPALLRLSRHGCVSSRVATSSD
jgi:acyl-CoA synthetase (AMP-forming)/AMP-acid ligase II